MAIGGSRDGATATRDGARIGACSADAPTAQRIASVRRIDNLGTSVVG